MAFPATPVLDSFNRANEGPPPSAAWTGSVRSGSVVGGSVVGNQCQFASAASAYWTAPFTADQEVYYTLVAPLAANGNLRLFARISSPGLDVNGYVLVLNEIGDLQIQRWDAGVPTTLGAHVTQLGAAGDSYGLSCTGTAIEGWYRAAGGGWVQLLSRSDPNYVQSGVIGIESINVTATIDDFGGGSLAAATKRPLTGVGI
jgi:hypothetical protein